MALSVDDEGVAVVQEPVEDGGGDHLVAEDVELGPEATIRKFRIVQKEGDREVSRLVDYYNLDVILAVGYRVSSARGTECRRWATGRLREYLVKGFTLDDERLKEGRSLGADYFDELLRAHPGHPGVGEALLSEGP